MGLFGGSFFCPTSIIFFVPFFLIVRKLIFTEIIGVFLFELTSVFCKFLFVLFIIILLICLRFLFIDESIQPHFYATLIFDIPNDVAFLAGTAWGALVEIKLLFDVFSYPTSRTFFCYGCRFGGISLLLLRIRHNFLHRNILHYLLICASWHVLLCNRLVRSRLI